MHALNTCFVGGMSYRKNATTLVIRTPKRYSSARIAREANKRRRYASRIPRSRLSLLPSPQSGPEQKAVGVFGNGVLAPAGAFNTNGINLLPVTLGTGPGAQRIGRKICLKSLLFRYGFQPDEAASTASDMRAVIVYDKQPSNNGAPAATVVFDRNLYYSPMNLNSADRFVTIMDEVCEMATSADLITSGKRYVKLNLETVFGANNGNDQDITTGALWLFVAHNDWATGVGNNVYLDVRTRFTDV